MRSHRVLVGFIGLAALLAGCGGAATAPSAPAAPSAPPASTAAASAKPAASTAAAASASAKPAASTAASSKPSAAANLEQVTVGTPGASAFSWPDYVAQAQGYFKQQGLDVNAVTTQTPSTTIKALIGGSINFGAASADAPISAIEEGAAITMVGQTVGNPAFSVITQPEIKTWADMKGATVAVSGPTDGAAVVFRLMASQKGLAAQKDYSFVSVGTTPARYAALQAKQAKAGILNQPVDFQAVADGFNQLDRSDKAIDHYAYFMLSAQKSWAEAHRDTVKRYLAALSKSIDWLYDPANKDAAIKLLEDKAKTPADAATKTYGVYVEQSPGKVLSKGAKIDVEGLKVYGQTMKDVGLIQGAVDPARWADLSYAG
jgi:NitT/TauT family transport system substrate-binding protein